MEYRINYVVVGLFVLILAACALITGLWLSAGFQTKTYNTYEILMYEPVSGLSEQAPVKFNGVQVGFIKSIDLNEKNPRQVILLAQIEAGTPITKSTTATLMSQGITGVTYIGLKARTPNADLLQKLPGQSYPIIPTSPSLLVELDTTIRELSGNINEISASIKQVLSTENIKNFNEILYHTKNILGRMDEHSDSILKNLDTVLNNLATSSHDFPQTIKKFNATLDETTAFLLEGQYAIQQWSSQVVPSTYSLVTQVSQVVADLGEITGELKIQPSLLIRGKVSPPSGPGE